MLDEKSVIPLYYQLKEILKDKIKEGSWQEGSKVPSERDLMEAFDVSRATVRTALRELIAEGLIYRKQGIGTFVSKSKVIQNLIGELSFNQQMERQGFKADSRVVYAGLKNIVPSRTMDMLSLKELQSVCKIIRVRLVNHEPLILETLYIPYQYAPDILVQDLENIAVFKYLEEDCKLNFTCSTLDIEPVAIDELEAYYLEVEVGKPALSLERVIYSNEQAIVIQKRIMRGDRGKFSFILDEGSQGKVLSLSLINEVIGNGAND